LVATDPKFPFSLRTTRANWVHEKKEADKPIVNDDRNLITKNGPPIIIFMLGGLSFSEMRVAYEISKEWNRDIYIGKSRNFIIKGTTAIYNPTQLVDILKELHKSDPLGTRIGAAFASNSLLSSGENVPSPTKEPIKTSKEKGKKK
jgi:syntaxin-binding protein 1